MVIDPRNDIAVSISLVDLDKPPVGGDHNKTKLKTNIHIYRAVLSRRCSFLINHPNIPLDREKNYNDRKWF